MVDQILSWLPLVLSLFLLSFIVLTLKRKSNRWGFSIAMVWFFGLLICVIAALRDGYGFSETSVLSFSGFPAALFSLLGLGVTVIPILTLFIRNQTYRQKAFILISVIFLVKFTAMEAIRFLA